MAANVETTLELGLREAAETIWARKVALEALGATLTPAGLELATAHARVIGRAEATAFALELLRGYGPVAEVLVDEALREIGATTWDRARIEVKPGLNLIPILDAIPLEASWSQAAIHAALVAPSPVRPL